MPGLPFRTVAMVGLILIMTALVESLAFATQLGSHNSGPKFSIVLESADFLGIERVELSGRNNKENFRCRLFPRNRASSSVTLCSNVATLTIDNHASYSFFVYIWRNHESQPIVLGQTAMLDGSEIEIKIAMRFSSNRPCSNKIKYRRSVSSLELFSIAVVRRAPPELDLERRWEPKADGAPLYQIKNNGKQTWHGVANLGNLFGRLEVLDKQLWNPYRRGRMCGTDSAGPSLPPNFAIESTEGFFLSTPSAFSPGKYRYILEISEEPIDAILLCDYLDTGAPTLRITNIYQLVDEFVIK